MRLGLAAKAPTEKSKVPHIFELLLGPSNHIHDSTYTVIQKPPYRLSIFVSDVPAMSADPDQNPSPADLAEREREDKERKIREDAEQAQLPYKWTQTIRDVDVTAPIPGNLKGRDLDVVLTKNKIRVAIKGQEPLIEVCQALTLIY
jgi:hypothetical protein